MKCIVGVLGVAEVMAVAPATLHMKRIIVLLAAMAAMVMVYAGAAWATPVSELEPNDSPAQAQNIDPYFSLDYDNYITDPTTVPHATVNGTGDGTVDYYSLTVPQASMPAAGVFDVDGAYPSFDSKLWLYDSNGVLITSADNAYTDPGSLDSICFGCRITFDSTLEYNFPSAGTYYIKVSKWSADSIPAGASYKLNVSVADHVDTAPSVSSTDPQNGTPDVLKTANATANFSEAVQNVNPNTFKLERKIVSKKGTKYEPVAASVTTRDNDTTAVLDPTEDLPKGAYRATLTGGVTDTTGNALADAPYIWGFTVKK